MTRLVVETANLRRVFEQRVALRGLDLQVRAGETVGIVGPNGAGKSTALSILATLVPPTSGIARVAGYDVCRETMEVRRRVGYAPEEPALFDALTGLEHLMMVVDLKGLDRQFSYDCVLELSENFEMRYFLSERIGQYSKGMRRKIMIIAAILGQPEVLILDEPIDGLDAKSRSFLIHYLQARAAGNASTVLCSHALEPMGHVCDRLCVLVDGVVVADRPTAAGHGGDVREVERMLLRLSGSRK